MHEAQAMLLKWEAGDAATRELWEMMNSWVYEGFEVTYKMLGVDFDKTYYESQTYLSGKNIIEEGLTKGILKRRVDNSIYIDLTADGLDEKTLLRGDGTSVYMTQDLGTAVQRAEEEHFGKMIYTVANEQDYHFKVLFLILKKLGYTWADGMYHLSYGMVELPEGKMKSREGTVVDADELMQDMIDTAMATSRELGKAEDLDDAEAEELYRTIGLGALKYFILKVDPKKKMLFNPAESIDFNGNTAPFIQFNYVRIKALLRKSKEQNNFEALEDIDTSNIQLLPKEKELIIKLYNFNATLNQAANEYSPALIANYVYDLAKEFSQYYHDVPILKEENKQLLEFRLHLSKVIGLAIKSSMKLLGIDVPERM
jgi:arginyl-tRNA synthetase